MREIAPIALACLLIACSTPEATPPASASVTDLATLTEEWGCGNGFYAGNPEQTTALHVSFNGSELSETEIELPDPEWSVVLLHGTNLFANWCDDVIESHEPTPVEHQSIEVVGGHLSISGEVPEPFSGGTLTVDATDLVVELPDGSGTAALGEITITNPWFGFFAG